MKSLFSLVFLLCISVAFAIKCKICVNSNSMADCIADEETVDCDSAASQLSFVPDRCVKMSLDYNTQGVQFKSFVKSCFSKELCEQGDDSFKACKHIDGATCEIDCCSSDNCNSGTAPFISVFLMIACVLTSLLRH